MSQKENATKSLVIIDGNALMHRAYHGVNKGFIPTYEGMPIGMVYGFTSTLLSIIDYFRPDILVVTFDTKEKTFRHEMDKEYKAHREKAPDDFYAQIPYLEEMIENFEIPMLKAPGFESDDIIGTLVNRAVDEGIEDVKILSGDLDFLQLVSDKIKLAKFNGGIDRSVIYGPDETKARYGITPDEIIDFKALMGDSSDNYKGVEGVGEKTASNLLNDYSSIEGIYEHLNELSPKMQEKFKEQKDYVMHCRKLATIRKDVPVEFSFEREFDFVPEKTIEFLNKMKFYSLSNRYQKLITNFDQAGRKRGVIEQKNSSDKMASSKQISLFDL